MKRYLQSEPPLNHNFLAFPNKEPFYSLCYKRPGRVWHVMQNLDLWRLWYVQELCIKFDAPYRIKDEADRVVFTSELT